MSQHTILVADEDQDTRIILRALLELHDFRVVEAGSAADATSKVNADISLVILNYPMMIAPELSLASWLRAQAATRDIPIINLTSRAVPLLIEEASRDGVTVTIAKPLDGHLILELARELALPVATR